MLAYRYDGPETTFNVGGGSRTALGDVIALVAAALGVRFDVRDGERARGDVADTFADTSRARRELGFAPRVAIAEGIRNEIAWYRAYAAEREGRTGSP
jgi:nucleoside-diphosphate-sugar epimerase